MKESGARRILRSIPLDMNGIEFLTDQHLDRLGKIDLLKEYIDGILAEIAAREPLPADHSRLRAKTQLTNSYVLRIYLQKYLRQHPELRDDMTLIVNQLPPGPEGLPIQIVVFCNEQAAAEYERVQADIFDHIIAILPEFGLKAFQGPTSDRYLHD